MNTKALRVIIADDHAVVRTGVKTTLAQHPIRFNVVAAVENGEELLDSLKTLPDIDVVITDYSMSKDGHDGLRLLRRLRVQYPRLAIVVLTVLDNEALLRSIHSLGIQNIVNKRGSEHRLIHMVEDAVRKIAFTSDEPHDASASTKRECRSPKNGSTALSPREAETLRMLLLGMSVSEIGLKLNRSKKTISAQKHAAMLKLGLENNAQLFRYLHDHFEN